MISRVLRALTVLRSTSPPCPAAPAVPSRPRTAPCPSRVPFPARRQDRCPCHGVEGPSPAPFMGQSGHEDTALTPGPPHSSTDSEGLGPVSWPVPGFSGSHVSSQEGTSTKASAAGGHSHLGHCWPPWPPLATSGHLGHPSHPRPPLARCPSRLLPALGLLSDPTGQLGARHMGPSVISAAGGSGDKHLVPTLG